MQKNSKALGGSGLLHELRTDAKMSEDEARAWIEQKVRGILVPAAMYRIRWPDDRSGVPWWEHPEIRVHIMSDYEVATDERKYREFNKLPKRRRHEPWEKRGPMEDKYDNAMGKAEVPRNAELLKAALRKAGGSVGLADLVEAAGCSREGAEVALKAMADAGEVEILWDMDGGARSIAAVTLAESLPPGEDPR